MDYQDNTEEEDTDYQDNTQEDHAAPQELRFQFHARGLRFQSFSAPCINTSVLLLAKDSKVTR